MALTSSCSTFWASEIEIVTVFEQEIVNDDHENQKTKKNKSQNQNRMRTKQMMMMMMTKESFGVISCCSTLSILTFCLLSCLSCPPSCLS